MGLFQEWKSTDSAAMAQYSLQHLPYVTAIGQYILGLLQLLEPLAKGEYQRQSLVPAACYGLAREFVLPAR